MKHLSVVDTKESTQFSATDVKDEKINPNVKNHFYKTTTSKLGRINLAKQIAQLLPKLSIPTKIAVCNVNSIQS